MSIKTECSKKNSFIWVILGIGIVLYLLVMYVVFCVPIWTIIKFVALNVVSIFLPGLAILCLLKIKLSRIGTFCTAYILGYALIVLEYFASEFFNRAISFTFITIVVAVASCGIVILQIRNNKTKFYCKNSDSEIIEIIVLAIFVGFNVLAYAGNYLGTDVVTTFDIHRDMQYWVNNTVALKLSWPADNLFMAGNTLNYHYFSNIPIAFLCDVYKIDVFSMSFPLYAMTKAVIVVGGVQFLLDTVKADRKTSILGYSMMLFTTGVEVVSVVTYVHHLLLLPFGFDIGFAYGVVFISFLIRQWDEEKFDVRMFIGTSLVWGMSVGAKAPVASVLILFPALICFYWLIKKRWMLAFGYGVPILLLFLAICKWCVGMFGVINGDSFWTISLYGMETIMNLGEPEYWAIVAQILVRVGRINPILAAIVRFIFVNPVIVLGTIIMYVVMIIGIIEKKVTEQELILRLTLGLTALLGLTLGVIINAGGDSEMYFSMAALIPLMCMFLSTVERYWEERKKDGRGRVSIRKCIEIIFVILVIVGAYRFLWVPRAGEGIVGGAVEFSIKGLKNIYYSMEDYDYSYQNYGGVRGTDVEALNWIKDNTESDALIMTDKAVIMDNAGYYMYGIFCERQQYLEGTNMLDVADVDIQNEVLHRKKVIYSVYGNVDGALQNAKEEGVDYIVQTVDITPEFVYDKSQLELVKSTETINIFRVK